MKKHVRSLLLLQGFCTLLLSPSAFAQTEAPSAKYKIVTYLPTWKAKYPASINDFDVRKVTHICIAFGNPDKDGNVIISDNGQAGVATVVSTAHAQGTKVMLSLGGWVCPEAIYSDLLRTKKDVFVNKIIQYVNDNNLDGVDVDLEGNVVNGSLVTASEYQAFITSLASRLRSQSRPMEISAALANWFSQYITTTAMNTFDFINLMAYDYAIAPSGTPGPHSSMSWAQENFNHWRNKGAAASKLVLGVPFYGYAWGSYATNGAGMDYCPIVKKYPGAENSDQQGSGGNAVYYNGIPTIRAKAQYVKSSNMGGIMIWEQTGDCPSGPTSLLDVINVVFETNVSVADPFADQISFEIFPNPASDFVNIKFNLDQKSNVALSIYSMDGRLVKQIEETNLTGQNILRVSTAELNSGIYILKLNTGSSTVVRKLSKE